MVYLIFAYNNPGGWRLVWESNNKVEAQSQFVVLRAAMASARYLLVEVLSDTDRPIDYAQ